MCCPSNEEANNYNNAGHSNHKSTIRFSETIFELQWNALFETEPHAQQTMHA
ncbi:hypothetical protein HanRHA438_Chr15g0729381 [Helianthus annuus]|nr:hypothetical protein HanRHA438_Chr15g0729381 [Helianthus annuus]